MERSSRKCPSCSHPMMDCEGVVQPKRGSGDYRPADWYCAECGYVIWTVQS